MAITFRPIRPEDKPFLSALYASTRQDEMSLVDWPAEQVAAFLQSQFELQHEHYHRHYPTASFQIIEQDGAPIGRLYVDRWETEIRLMDIALVPEQRGKGLGTRLMQDLLAEGAERGLPVRIHVEVFNPALRLYRRLGFEPVEDKGVYLFMERRPEALVEAAAET